VADAGLLLREARFLRKPQTGAVSSISHVEFPQGCVFVKRFNGLAVPAKTDRSEWPH
jgi:hypothetical protein